MAKATAKKKDVSFPSAEEVFTATFDTIAEKGLGKTRLGLIVDHLAVPLSEFYHEYPSVEAILGNFSDYIDNAMIKAIDTESNHNKREIYFDLFMSRFDILQEYRPGVVRWLKDLLKHPDLWNRTLKRFEQSLGLMLDIAKDSPLFPVKKIGLAAIYAHVLKVWLDDHSADMAKTMAALDKDLGRAEEFSGTFLTRKKQL